MFTIEISVRELAEYVCRSGSIDKATDSLKDPNLLTEGIKAHEKFQKLQKTKPLLNYRSEVSLSHINTLQYKKIEFLPDLGKFVTETNDPNLYCIKVQGRADGIFKDGEDYVIDEIKSTYADISKLKEAKEVHLMQARIYAYFYCLDKKLSSCKVRISYISLSNEKEKFFYESHTLSDLEEMYMELLDKTQEYIDYQIAHILYRNNNLHTLPFPYEYRPGQEELIKNVYISILRNKKLFIQAPTGVGKTLATLYPSLKAVGEKLSSKIFYLTAKTVTTTVARQAVIKLNETITEDDTTASQPLQSLQKLRATILYAKEKICPLSKAECTKESCPYANGHFDRVDQGLKEIIQTKTMVDKDVLLEISDKYTICPYYLSYESCLFSDVVICDYNYAFDPNVLISSFFGESRGSFPDISIAFTDYLRSLENKVESTGKYIFLVDEAHNLIGRANEMYSAKLSISELKGFKKVLGKIRKEYKGKNEAELKKRFSTISSYCTRIINGLTELDEVALYDNNKAFYPDITNYDSILSKFYNLELSVSKFLSDHELRDVLNSSEDKDYFINTFFKILAINMVAELLDDKYKVYLYKEWRGDISFNLRCMEPSTNLENYLMKARSTVFFSATLLPVNFYKKELSTTKDDYAIYAPSSFDNSRRKVLVANNVSSKYTRRNEQEFEKIANYVKTFINAKAGNYIVFFPSYAMLESVSPYIIEETNKITYITQTRDMDEAAREAFLQAFE
ncbi:MAG: hypothetical protein K6D02_03235, partial [Lachnospiraceae bacterium]|nr:hypothetical protein [Lachnospiraceae bacterium]